MPAEQIDIPLKRKPREFDRVSFEHIAEAMRELELNEKDMAEALGISPSAMGDWRRKNDAPRMTVLAVKGLYADKGRDLTETVILAKVPNRVLPAVKAMLEGVSAYVIKVEM